MTAQSTPRNRFVRVLDNGGLFEVLLLMILMQAARVYDGIRAARAPTLAGGAEIYFFDSPFVEVLLPILIGIAAVIAYLVWIVRALRWAAREQPDMISMTPGKALCLHILPPFFLLAPYQIVTNLVHISSMHAGKQKPEGDYLVIIWWGAFWGAVLLCIANELLSRTDGLIDTPHYFTVAAIISGLVIVSALSLLLVSRKITRNLTAHLGLA